MAMMVALWMCLAMVALVRGQEAGGCGCGVPCPPHLQLVATGCASNNTIGRTADHFVLDGRVARSISQHCLITDSVAVAAVEHAYRVSVSYYNLYGTSGIGHLGFALNMVDGDNYDYIYVRPHTSNKCVQRGKMVSGTYTQMEQNDCINRALHMSWFDLSVEVSGGQATLFIDGVIAHQFSTTFTTKSKAALFIWNGYNNVAFFRNFKLSLL